MFDEQETLTAQLREEVWEEGDPPRLVLRDPHSGFNTGTVAVLCRDSDPLLAEPNDRVYGPDRKDEFVEKCRLEALAAAETFLDPDEDEEDNQ